MASLREPYSELISKARSKAAGAQRKKRFAPMSDQAATGETRSDRPRLQAGLISEVRYSSPSLEPQGNTGAFVPTIACNNAVYSTKSRGYNVSCGLNRRLVLRALASGVFAGGGWSLLQPMLTRGQASRASGVRDVVFAQADAMPRAPTEMLDHVVVNVGPTPAELRDWAAFRATYVTAEGRVVDIYNHGISHTESQGLGMLFAVAFNDRDSFDRIWNWTNTALARPNDALHAWRYDPNNALPVSDMNNATDGDIYIAAALVRAAARWQASAYMQAGQAIARDILGLLVTRAGGRTVLLPGASGFSFPNYVVVNLSHYVFPLLYDLQSALPSLLWDSLLRDGHKLAAEAKFGRHHLPPDWLTVSAWDGGLALWRARPSRFAFDAIRVPLFAAWANAPPNTFEPAADFWGDNPEVAPAWIDLETDAASPWHLLGGMVAVARLVGRQAGRFKTVHFPASMAHEGYYSSALQLLTRVAIREIDGRAAEAQND